MYLIKKVETYRCETEQEADDKIAAVKASGVNVTKSTVTLKTKKSKGEIVDSWYICEITTTYEE